MKIEQAIKKAGRLERKYRKEFPYMRDIIAPMLESCKFPNNIEINDTVYVGDLFRSFPFGIAIRSGNSTDDIKYTYEAQQFYLSDVHEFVQGLFISTKNDPSLSAGTRIHHYYESLPSGMGIYIVYDTNLDKYGCSKGYRLKIEMKITEGNMSEVLDYYYLNTKSIEKNLSNGLLIDPIESALQVVDLSSHLDLNYTKKENETQTELQYQDNGKDNRTGKIITNTKAQLPVLTSITEENKGINDSHTLNGSEEKYRTINVSRFVDLEDSIKDAGNIAEKRKAALLYILKNYLNIRQ
jgi:hypothetical protein